MNKKGVKIALLLANMALVFFLILLSNLKVLPLRASDFAFFSFIVFLLALYRPGWTFLFFIGTIPLENINLAPSVFGIAVRPYQFLATLIIAALIIRFLLKKLNFALPKWKWFDLLPIFLVAGSFLSLINAPDPSASFKQTIILFSFTAIYFLARIYLQTLEDFKKIIPFFLSSSLVVIFYGIWQNIRFLSGLSNFEAMPGRPNATFTEPEWLGSFLIILATTIYSLIYYLRKNNSNKKVGLALFYSFYVPLVITFILLTITVSRSSWLGVFSTTAVFLFLLLTELKIQPTKWRWLDFAKTLSGISLSLIFGILFVYIFNLTNFQLGNRVQSTASGLQKITISCQKETTLPESIANVSELEKFNCRHINLEEIEKEKSAGKIVAEIFRQDPNVNTRKIVYQKTWQEIKNHPILGIGWGSTGKILGTDERGTPLNASNIFLEVWLGSGILGLLAFTVLLGYIFIKNTREFLSSENPDAKIFAIFILSALLGLLIFNLFNSSLLLAFFWVFLGISMIKK